MVHNQVKCKICFQKLYGLLWDEYFWITLVEQDYFHVRPAIQFLLIGAN